MTPSSPPRSAGDSDMRSTYLRVLVVEVLVLAALWLLQQTFTS